MNLPRDDYSCLDSMRIGDRLRLADGVFGRSESRGKKKARKMSNETKRPKAKVFLVDGHPLVREHLRALIQREADLEVCGEAGDGPTALSLISQHDPDLVILDVALNGSNSLDLLETLKKLRPRLLVLVLSMHDETLYAERVLRAGAMGYVTKEEAPISILSAIRRVLGGQAYLSERMAGHLAGRLVRAGRAVAEEIRL